MSFSKTNIFNLALLNLGVSNLVQNSIQDSPEALIMTGFYEVARDTVLEDHDWSFANAYQKVSTAEKESLDPNLPFVFTYPSDCIAPRAIIDPNDNKEKKVFQAIDSQGQKIILAEIDTGILRYTKRVDNESYFTAPFVTALSYYLAYMAAQAVVGSGNKKNTNLQDYQLAMRKAIVTDARKNIPNDQDDSIYTDCR